MGAAMGSIGHYNALQTTPTLVHLSDDYRAPSCRNAVLDALRNNRMSLAALHDWLERAFEFNELVEEVEQLLDEGRVVIERFPGFTPMLALVGSCGKPQVDSQSAPTGRRRGRPVGRAEVFRAVSLAPRGVTSGEIAAALGTTADRVGAVVLRLEEARRIERRESERGRLWVRRSTAGQT